MCLNVIHGISLVIMWTVFHQGYLRSAPRHPEHIPENRVCVVICAVKAEVGGAFRREPLLPQRRNSSLAEERFGRAYRSCADYLSFSYVSKDNDGVKEQLNEAQKKTKELRELSRELTSEQIAVFLALLDVGEFDYYSEQFDAILDYMKESNFDRMWSIRKIASNRDYIAAGLKKCGQPYFFSLLTENCTNVDSANKETVHL